MMPTERDETLAMTWPADTVPPLVALAPGYTLRAGVEQVAFHQVQASIGFDVTDEMYGALTERAVAACMVLAGAPVAAAVGERRDGGWVELGWVAVSPAHRGEGLGLAICASLTRELLAAGETHLFGSTQDHRLAALRIYFALGFHPVFRKEKAARWRAACRRLSQPYAPDEWGWPPAS